MAGARPRESKLIVFFQKTNACRCALASVQSTHRKPSRGLARKVAGEKVRTLTGQGGRRWIERNSQSDGIAANHSHEGFEQAAQLALREDSIGSEGMNGT